MWDEDGVMVDGESTVSLGEWTSVQPHNTFISMGVSTNPHCVRFNGLVFMANGHQYNSSFISIGVSTNPHCVRFNGRQDKPTLLVFMANGHQYNSSFVSMNVSTNPHCLR
jgi:hypothetical protein